VHDKNPLLIHGQSHGGIAQGIGQALWEQCVYDPQSGQLLSGSLLDYALPRADLLPGFDTEISEVSSTTNPLGMRGGSEGGITPGLAAVSERGGRCARRVRRRTYRIASHARARLEGHPRRALQRS
jgi:Molybdopterin-binding domain of aldehyde dehydrogenase